MKKLAIVAALSLLAGCSAMSAKHTPIKTADGSNAFFLTSMYGGFTGTREQSLSTLDRYSRNLCEGEYTRLSEQDNVHVNKLGQTGIGVLREVHWEVQCNKNPKS